MHSTRRLFWMAAPLPLLLLFYVLSIGPATPLLMDLYFRGLPVGMYE